MELNDEDRPLRWCVRCLGICILEACGVEYCADCGGTELAEGSDEEWEALRGEREREERDYAERVEDGCLAGRGRGMWSKQ